MMPRGIMASLLSIAEGFPAPADLAAALDAFVPRKRAGVGKDRPRPGRPLRPRSAADDVDIPGVHQVARGPAVEVVILHAISNEVLQFLVEPAGLAREVAFEPDVLVITRVVAFVELVASAELGSDRIPQKLHHLGPRVRILAERPAKILVD